MPRSCPRILLIDDHPGILELVATLLRERFEVTGRLDALSIVEDFERLDPEVVLLDIAMPHLDGFAAARLLKLHHPEARIVFLTGDMRMETVTEATLAGGCGLVLKTFAAGFLLPALESVLPSAHPS